MVRNSLNFVSWKMQKEVGADLKLIYSATTVDLAEQRLAEFEVKWDKDYQSISLSWRRNWAHIIPFFDYPPEIRKVIYTTNAIESINMSLRKVIKTRSSFPTDEVGDQAVLSGAEEHQQEVDDADSRLESSPEPLHHPVR